MYGNVKKKEKVKSCFLNLILKSKFSFFLLHYDSHLLRVFSSSSESKVPSQNIVTGTTFSSFQHFEYTCLPFGI